MPEEKLRYSHFALLLVGIMCMRFWTRFFFRIEFKRARIDLSQTYIFVANHRSFYDPPLIGMFLDRPLSYFLRSSLLKIPIIGQFLRSIDSLPVDRDEPQLEVMKRTVQWLKDGRNLLIFPEGTRTRTGRLGTLRDGPAMFARRARVSVVPVYVAHTDVVWPRGWPCPIPGRGKLGLYMGRPIAIPDGLRGRAQDEWLSTRISSWLQAMERRVYGKSGAPARVK